MLFQDKLIGLMAHILTMESKCTTHKYAFPFHRLQTQHIKDN